MFFRSKSNFTTPVSPLAAAHKSGVQPCLFLTLLEASSAYNSIFITSSHLRAAAHESGVQPCLFSTELGLTSSHLKSIFTISSFLCSAAQESGVRTDLVLAWSGETLPPPKTIFKPHYNCPCESSNPHAIGCINVPFLHLQYSRDHLDDPVRYYSGSPVNPTGPFLR